MSVILNTIILGFLPITELRGAIVYAIAAGLSPFPAFIFATLGNLLVAPLVFLFLDYLHHHFMKFKFYENLFYKHVERSKKKIEKHIGTKWEYVVLCLFVAIPFPLTGAYTGTLLAWLFKLNKKKSLIAISLGVIIAGIIVTLLIIGFSTFLKKAFFI